MAETPGKGEELWVSGEEMRRRAEENAQLMREQCYIEGDKVVFNTRPPLDPYDIRLERCATPEAILGWVRHLCKTKQWMTADLTGRFIDVATEHHGLQISHP